MSQHTRPIWFSVLVTPWVVPLAFFLWSAVSIFFTTGASGFKDWQALFAFFVFGLPPAYAAMLIFGLPYVLWLRSRGTLTVPLVCIGAVLSSIVAVPVYFWLVDPQIPPTGISILWFAAFGLVSGVAFCIAAGITFRPSGRAKKLRAA